MHAECDILLTDAIKVICTFGYADKAKEICSRVLSSKETIHATFIARTKEALLLLEQRGSDRA